MVAVAVGSGGRGVGVGRAGTGVEVATISGAASDARVCAGTVRCYAFSDRLEDARETCTLKGRCRVGWIVRWDGRESWDVWLEVGSGLVMLVLKAHA
jgi:hypothetical protein